MFILLLFFISHTLHAQSDFLLLKKHHKTLATYYTDSHINFRINTGEWLEGYINKISNDTIILEPYELVYFRTTLGFSSYDTLWKNKRIIEIKSIDAFPRDDKGFGYIKDGFLFQAAGAGYILLNVINTASDHENLFAKGNGTKLGVAAAVFAIGTLMHRTHSPIYKLGGKYKLQYIKINSSAN